jgi:hypothetical protein
VSLLKEYRSDIPFAAYFAGTTDHTQFYFGRANTGYPGGTLSRRSELAGFHADAVSSEIAEVSTVDFDTGDIEWYQRLCSHFLGCHGNVRSILNIAKMDK